MKNGNLTQFLDTGWYTEAVLYFNGRVYWCEGTTDFETGITTFFVDSWKAECGGENYHVVCEMPYRTFRKSGRFSHAHNLWLSETYRESVSQVTPPPKTAQN